MGLWFGDHGKSAPPDNSGREARTESCRGLQRGKMSSRRLTKQQGGTRKGKDVEMMEEASSSSDEDSAPETMSSNTRTAAAGAAARAAKARARPTDSMSDDSSDGGGSDDDGEDGDSSDNFGKRKADDFLRRQELVMDAGFKATVVLPGDDVTDATTRTTRSLRLGPGLVQHTPDKVLATRAGVLRYRPPCSYWVESNGRRYGARVEDQVLGVVEDRMGESYKVNIFGRYGLNVFARARVCVCFGVCFVCVDGVFRIVMLVGLPQSRCRCLLASASRNRTRTL